VVRCLRTSSLADTKPAKNLSQYLISTHSASDFAYLDGDAPQFLTTNLKTGMAGAKILREVNLRLRKVMAMAAACHETGFR
jgi:hypothetical protein